MLYRNDWLCEGLAAHYVIVAAMCARTPSRSLTNYANYHLNRVKHFVIIPNHHPFSMILGMVLITQVCKSSFNHHLWDLSTMHTIIQVCKHLGVRM